MVSLIGPGGAGKTTIGAALAKRLGLSFVDLDALFFDRFGDISVYLDVHGYGDYAERNVGLFSECAGEGVHGVVVALSSGFMTYRDDVHPDYAGWRQRIASSDTTFVLLPSLDVEICVAEIVRRQLGRRFARAAEREEQVIRTRFPIYSGLPARKVITMRPVSEVVAGLVSRLAAQHATEPEGHRPPSLVQRAARFRDT